jgi:2-phosphoglycerate kinase
MRQPPLGIVIGGSSHVGKTILAKGLAHALERELVSTDNLGRHPGRPWPSVRAQVAEYYSSLSDDTVHWFLQVHHENMWPRIQSIVSDFQNRSTPFVLEGAALRPEYVAQLDQQIIKPVFLYADDDFLRSRMMDESAHKDAVGLMVPIIDKFIERSIRENRDMLAAAQSAGIQCIDVALPGSLETLHAELVAVCSIVED